MTFSEDLFKTIIMLTRAQRRRLIIEIDEYAKDDLKLEVLCGKKWDRITISYKNYLALMIENYNGRFMPPSGAFTPFRGKFAGIPIYHKGEHDLR